MALRCRRLREFSRFFPRIHAGDHYIQCRKATTLSALSTSRQSHAWKRIGTTILQSRFSTTSEAPCDSSNELDLLSFIRSSMDDLEGPCHWWLNRSKGKTDFFISDGSFLVFAGRCETFLTTSCEPVTMLEKLKSLQQRFPQLHVIGFLSGSSICSAAERSHIIQYIVKEYITFPIIFSNKSFSEMENGACYILCKDFKSPVLYHEKDLDLKFLEEAVEEFYVQDDGRARSVNNLTCTWAKKSEIIKEAHICSLKNLLFSFPGCVSADETGNRLFLSDSGHHRIIICDGNGKILDCIGSSPGFQDGIFESAKMVFPASSVYVGVEDCLYFVDSENHAIRKADLGKRVLETVYPYDTSKRINGFWTKIMIKLGLRSSDRRSEEFDSRSLIFPWHLIEFNEDSFCVINRSFDTLWVLDLDSGEIKEVVKGLSKILDVCGPQIMEKVSLLEQMPCDWLQQQTNAVCAPERLPYAGLISSWTTFQNHVILCDMIGQRILKLSEGSGVCSTFQFSNFGILGLPYWLASSLERVYAVAGGNQEAIDQVECFSLLPGKIGIQLNLEIPVDTELVEPVQEGCIWRQARGAATHIKKKKKRGAATEESGLEDVGRSTEKKGSAQKWYDDLDKIASSVATPESELTVEDDCITLETEFQDGNTSIDFAVNTSPGTSEVIVDAAIYLKLTKKQDLLEDNQEKNAERIADILNSERSAKMERDSFIHYLLKSNRDVRELIFMKPLHVRIKLDCLDHPKAANGKDIILTNSMIELNVSLDS